MTGRIELAEDGTQLIISFPYREDLVAEVRKIPGRRWNKSNKEWRAPVAQIDLVIKRFMRHGFTLAPEVSSLLAGTDRPAQPLVVEQPARVELHAFSISELNQKVRDSLRMAFPHPVWVIGEILGLDKNKGRKHLFFQLVEKSEGQQHAAASVDVAFFESTISQLRKRLERACEPLTLRDGIRIRARVRVDLYPASGRFQVVIEDIDPSFTLGELALGRERIHAQLRKLGLHERNARLPLPMPPSRIGVLTSLDSDGWNDFRKQLEASGIGFAVTAYAIRVQGNLLKPTILSGLAWFKAHAAHHDVLCILRGGGSRSDLAWFDDEEVALAVARHPLKILCGIGHERDRSVLDLIAHSEKTPTAVAGFLIQSVREGERLLCERLRRLAARAERRLRDDGESLSVRGETLRHLVAGSLGRSREILGATGRRLARETETTLEREGGLVLLRAGRLGAGSRRRIEQAATSLTSSEDRRRLLDPRRVLQRGYAVLHDKGGSLVKSVAQVHLGMELDVTVRDGRLRVRTEDVSRQTNGTE